MKKKSLNGKLSLKKMIVSELIHREAVMGGGGSVDCPSVGCNTSVISACLCPIPPSGGVPCCPAPVTFLCTREDEGREQI